MTTEELQQLSQQFSSKETVPEGSGELGFILIEDAYQAGFRKALELVLDKVEELEEEVHTSCSIKWLLDTNKLNAIFGKLNGSPK